MEKKKLEDYLWILILLGTFLFKIGILYYGYYHKNYLVPPGNDVVVHYGIIEKIIQDRNLNFSIYPPGFHLLIIAISRIFRQDIWSILTNWTPILIILPSAAMFFLLKQIFTLKVSVLSVAILIITSSYPMYAFFDGNYPDMLAYGVFAVLLFAFLIRFFKDKNYLNLIFVGLFLILIGFTHHFTFFNILAILICFTLLESFIYLWKQDLQIYKKIFLNFAVILSILALSYLLADKLYGATAIKFINGFLKQSPFLHDAYLNMPLEYSDYPKMTGELIWYFGLAGFFYILISSFSHLKENKTKLLLIIWFLLLYILSRFSASGIPARFTRELALPLTVFLAFLFDYLIENNALKKKWGQIFAFSLIGYLLIINSALYSGIDKIPDTFDRQIWYWPIDQEKVDFLSQNIPLSASILYNPNASPFFPVKTKNTIVPLKLTDDQVKITKRFMDFPENINAQNNYMELISNLRKEYHVEYIFNDVKPPGNTSDIYPTYVAFDEKRRVLEDLAASQKIVKTFVDSATIYRIN